MYKKKGNEKKVRDVVLRNIKEYGLTEEQFFSKEEPYIYMLDEAVEYVKDWMLLNDDTITIIGDYDTDGIMATYIMYKALQLYGRTPETRLPRRFSEGYGLSEKIIDEISSGLIITVDNGIASIPAIKKAKAKGLSVVVVDHHIPPVKENGSMDLPDADIIIDPHVYPEKSEFIDYCGAGLALRFAKKLLPENRLFELVNAASIATVADVMPLYGANRKLVLDGLDLLNKGRIGTGLKALTRKLGFDGHQTESDYGFKLGPIFNASGRLYDNGAERVLRLLKLDADDPRLSFKVNNVIDANEKRKAVVKTDMERVLSMLKEDRPIVVYDEHIGEGIVGLIAGRLTEIYKCPSIVFTKTEKTTKDGDIIIKGSGRSIPEVNLKKVLDKIKDTIEGYGGHSGAAGLSIRLSKLDDFTNAFKEACGVIPKVSNTVYYDIEAKISEIPEIVEEIVAYAPYGNGNPKVAVRMKLDVSGYTYTRIGDGSHFMLKSDSLTIMGFGMADKYEAADKPKVIDCIGYLNENWYKDNRTYQYEIISFSE